jgi:hypothetical protein
MGSWQCLHGFYTQEQLNPKSKMLLEKEWMGQLVKSILRLCSPIIQYPVSNNLAPNSTVRQINKLFVFHSFMIHINIFASTFAFNVRFCD